MLPCNVVVQDTADGDVEEAVIDPVASMAAVENPALKTSAGKVRDMLKAVVDAL